MTYVDKMLNETVKFLRQYGITQADIDAVDDDVFWFLYETGNKRDFGISDAYESIYEKLCEDVYNSIKFTKLDIIDACVDAINYNGMDDFLKYMTTEAYGSVFTHIPKSVKTDEDIEWLINTDADFYNDIASDIRSAIIYDAPSIGVSPYVSNDGGFADRFWNKVYDALPIENGDKFLH